MARPIILSNGEMLVGLNEHGCVHDFYYPYVGQENHASARLSHHRIGIWVDDQFSWLDDGSWTIDLSYGDDTLVGNLSARNEKLQLELTATSFVDNVDSIFARRFTVKNIGSGKREVRLFFHQAFQISDSNRGGTAQYHPRDHMVVHYKGSRAFAMYAESEGVGFDQYSIGIFGIEGKQGTYRDAEDGELSNNPVEHGRVDSVIRVTIQAKAGAEQNVDYWVAAARHPDTAIKIAREFREDGIESRRSQVEQYWQEWVGRSDAKLSRLPDAQRDAARKSLLLIKSHVDQRGGVLASADSDMLNYGRDYYGYCWPRDAVNALWPLVKLGYTEEAINFFEFCGRIRHANGYLMHKYQFDGAVGSSWHPYIFDGEPELPIQEDETAAVVFLAEQYHQYADDDDYTQEVFGAFVRPAAEFMTGFIDADTKLPHRSYDLWEERFGTHTYTVAVTYAALIAASKLARQYGTAREAKRWQKAADDMKKAADKLLWNKSKKYFYRSLIRIKGSVEFDDTVDIASLYGAVTYGLVDVADSRVTAALATASKLLRVETPTGSSIARYEGDKYHLCDEKGIGNPWIITTLWMAKLYHASGDNKAAQQLLDWAMSVMAPTGILPEQIDPRNGSHISVSPLTWSQAELLDTILLMQNTQPVGAPDGGKRMIRVVVRKG